MPKNSTPNDRNCYEVSFLALRSLPPGTRAVLVHGYPRLTAADGDAPAGTKYGHAWLELEGVVPHGMPLTGEGDPVVCWDWMARHMASLAPYYAARRIDAAEGARYTLQEARAATVLTLQALYYAAGRIDAAECTRYTLQEAQAAIALHETYGPWATPPSDAVFAD